MRISTRRARSPQPLSVVTFLPASLGTPFGDELVGEAHIGGDVGEAALRSLQDGLPFLQHEPLVLDGSEKHIARGEAHLAAELRRDDQASLRSHGDFGRMDESFHGPSIVPRHGAKCQVAGAAFDQPLRRTGGEFGGAHY